MKLKEPFTRNISVKVGMVRGKHNFQCSFNFLKEWVCSLKWECSWQKMLTVHPLISLKNVFLIMKNSKVYVTGKMKMEHDIEYVED